MEYRFNSIRSFRQTVRCLDAGSASQKARAATRSTPVTGLGTSHIYGSTVAVPAQLDVRTSPLR